MPDCLFLGLVLHMETMKTLDCADRRSDRKGEFAMEKAPRSLRHCVRTTIFTLFTAGKKQNL